MANYVSNYTGAKIDEAVGKALSGTATVTADSIKTALGYTPANATDVETLTNKVESGVSDEDKASIALEVLALIDASSVAQVVVDDNKNITLGGDLADGEYTLKYENADGSTTKICTLTISGGSGEGSGGGDSGDAGDDETGDTTEPDTPVVTPTGNLFVASTCTLNKRINSSGLEKDQNYTFLTDYIDIGDCLAQGGTNQIHFRDFWVYQMTADDVSSTGNDNLASSAYRGINYYDASGTFLGQNANYYTQTAVTDTNGDYVITLDSTKTTATKIRVVGTLNAVLTSTDQLSSCKLTLNELIAG